MENKLFSKNKWKKIIFKKFFKMWEKNFSTIYMKKFITKQGVTCTCECMPQAAPCCTAATIVPQAQLLDIHSAHTLSHLPTAPINLQISGPIFKVSKGGGV